MKKFVSLLLVFILLIGCFSISVSAEGNIVVMGQMRSKKLHSASATNHKQTAETTLSKYVDLSDFTSLVMSGVSDCQEYIDVSAYNIPVSALNAITDYFFYGVPKAFNVSQMGCSYYDNTNTISDIIVIYNSFSDTANEYDACISLMSSAADEILSGIKGNNKLNDEQKLLLIHDRLALWNTYGYPENTTTIEAHTAYGALGNRMSVCQGYAMAYMYLLEQVGIDSYYCSSEDLCHGWNIVFLNGKKYHFYVTWYYTYYLGDVRHHIFLRSRIVIYATGHEANDYDTTPTDTKYDNCFWQDSQTEFQLIDNEIYYIDNNAQALKRYSDKSTLCSVAATWDSDDNNYWVGNFTRLSSDGRSLFYSQPKAVYRFDLTTNKSEKIYTTKTSQYDLIYGFTYEDGNLVCDINNTPPGASSSYGKYQIVVPYKYNYGFTYGDTTDDEQINNKDLSLLMQYINGWAVEININAADVNADESINNKDYGLLMQYINNWDIVLG